MKNYYYILGIKEDATETDIKTAYRKLSLKFHPDKNDGDDFFKERFQEIQEAYQILSSPTKRVEYNTYYQYKHQQNYNNKSEYSHYTNNSHQSNKKQVNTNLPEVEYFQADKGSILYNEVVTLSWKVINADEIIIKPFGAVPLIGSKKYRIKRGDENGFFNIEFTATNTHINKSTVYSLKLRVETTQERYLRIENEEKRRIENEEKAGNWIQWVILIIIGGFWYYEAYHIVWGIILFVAFTAFIFYKYK